MHGMIDVRAHGAAGDGATDDTNAIRQAIAAVPEGGGVVLFPPGIYRTDTVKVPPFTTLKGYAAYGYFEPGCVRLVPATDSQPAMIDMDNINGGRVIGLALDGKDTGSCMHGIRAAKGKKTGYDVVPNYVVEDCWIQHFTGSGIFLDGAQVFCVRRNQIQNNGRDGIDGIAAFDGWIIDNQIGHNGRYGIGVMASTTITANRIEQNTQAGIFFNSIYVEDTQVNANHFCSEHGPAIEVSGFGSGSGPYDVMAGLTITGNLIRNSARNVPPGDSRSCHILLRNARGLTCTGNSLHRMVGVTGDKPSYGIVIEGLIDAFVGGNALHQAAGKELIHDHGGHTNCVVGDNPGSCFSNPREPN